MAVNLEDLHLVKTKRAPFMPTRLVVFQEEVATSITTVFSTRKWLKYSQARRLPLRMRTAHQCIHLPVSLPQQVQRQPQLLVWDHTSFTTWVTCQFDHSTLECTKTCWQEVIAPATLPKTQLHQHRPCNQTLYCNRQLLSKECSLQAALLVWTRPPHPRWQIRRSPWWPTQILSTSQATFCRKNRSFQAWTWSSSSARHRSMRWVILHCPTRLVKMR